VKRFLVAAVSLVAVVAAVMAGPMATIASFPWSGGTIG
jgi:hypothetical protein